MTRVLAGELDVVSKVVSAEEGSCARDGQIRRTRDAVQCRAVVAVHGAASVCIVLLGTMVWERVACLSFICQLSKP